MTRPTAEEVRAMKSLGLSPATSENPYTLVRLAALVARLQERVAQLEAGGKKSRSR